MAPRAAPSVLDPDEVVDHVPGSVSLLTEPPQTPGDHPSVVLCELREDQVAAFTYSSASALIAMCGTGQSWRWVPSTDVPEWGRRYGFDVVLLDVAPPTDWVRPEVDPVDAPDAGLIPELSTDGVVYLPSRPVREGDRRVDLELQPDKRGHRTLLVYTSQAELVAGCGPHQAWAAVPVDRLEQVATDAGAEKVLFNPVLSEEARHTGPVQDWNRDGAGGRR